MNECICGRPTRDGRFLCDQCKEVTDRALGDATALDDELETTMTRQRGVTYNGGGGRSTETPLPWHEKAADARRNLRATLVAWVRFCHEESVKGAPVDLPANTIGGMTSWLLNVTDGLTLHDIATEAHDEITDAVATAERVLSWRRKERIYLGPCTYQDVPENECPGDVYAIEGEPVGFCEECERGVTVAIRQGQLDTDLHDRLLSAADIADWAVRMGLSVPRETVKRRVLSWHRHKRIHAKGSVTAPSAVVPLFRYGDVRLLLHQEFNQRDTA